MNTLKFYPILSVFLLLMMSLSTVSASNEPEYEHFGFIESVGDSIGDKKDLKLLQVSGRRYKFDWSKVSVLYKGVNVQASDLETGMKIRFKTSNPKSNKVVEITILTRKDSLINH